MAAARLRFGSVSHVGNDWEVDWVLKRNCSFTPRRLMGVYASLCAVSLGIASYFWWQGATLVMPFAGLELLAVGVAFLAYARHAADRERLALRADRLIVEHIHGGRVERAQFQPGWVRVEPQHGDGSLIELTGQGQSVAVGRYVRPELRPQLAEELRAALRQGVPGGRQVEFSDAPNN